jgi:hypothetical protein
MIETIKEIDLQRTLIMFKENKEKVKREDKPLNILVFEKPKDLSWDLEEEEPKGSSGHKNINLLLPKQKNELKIKFAFFV